MATNNAPLASSNGSPRPLLLSILSDTSYWTDFFVPINAVSGVTDPQSHCFSSVVVAAELTEAVVLAVSGAIAGGVPIVAAIGGKGAHAVLQHIIDAAVASGKAPSDVLRWVHALSSGVDSYRLGALSGPAGVGTGLDGVPVSNMRGVFSAPIAEHVVLSCLYFNRKVWKIQQQRREKTWDQYPSVEMSEQKMGIIGYGDIASACGKAVRSFGMDVTGLRRSAVPAGTVDKYGVKVVSGDAALEKLLAESDFVLNLMPNTADNYHMFNKELFGKMKSGAVFINIGRGAAVDEDALYDALTSGHLAGAALDVFEVEPLPSSSKLWSLPDDKVLMTPHNCNTTTKCYAESADFFGKLATAFVEEGTIPEYLVDVRKGY